MDHSSLYADPYYPSFFATLGRALDAWAEEGSRSSFETWEAANRLHAAISLLTVGSQDPAVLLALEARDTTVKLGADDELNELLGQLAVVEMNLSQPEPPPRQEEHYIAWHDAFLQGVAAACLAIDGPDDPLGAVEPHYVPDRAMDSMMASVVYLSAWRVPGFSAGEEFVHWCVFGAGGQPPPKTGSDTAEPRFAWMRIS